MEKTASRQPYGKLRFQQMLDECLHREELLKDGVLIGEVSWLQRMPSRGFRMKHRTAHRGIMGIEEVFYCLLKARNWGCWFSGKLGNFRLQGGFP